LLQDIAEAAAIRAEKIAEGDDMDNSVFAIAAPDMRALGIAVPLRAICCRMH
jgi:hypothetical protein